MNPQNAYPEPNALVAPVTWLQATLVGSLATIVAIIVIAAFGIMMLSGRISARRGAQLIIGCFVVFGASTIAAGIMGALKQPGENAAIPQPPPAMNGPVTAQAPATNSPYDPYAGAALPPRR